jgi:hypothetical protein
MWLDRPMLAVVRYAELIGAERGTPATRVVSVKDLSHEPPMAIGVHVGEYDFQDPLGTSVGVEIDLAGVDTLEHPREHPAIADEDPGELGVAGIEAGVREQIEEGFAR